MIFALANLFCFAQAHTVEVRIGIAPAQLYTVEVEVGSPPSTHRFESGVPLEATVSVVTHPGGYEISVDLIARKNRVDRSLSKPIRAEVESLVGRNMKKNGFVARPTLVVLASPGSTFEYVVGGELDGSFYGVKVMGRVL